MGEGEQAEVAALVLVGAIAETSALAACDRRDRRFDLRMAAIGRSVEPHLHDSKMSRSGREAGDILALQKASCRRERVPF